MGAWMTKKQEEKREKEIMAIECELRLMAVGALGHAQIDPECGCDLFAVFDAEVFSRWLSAIENYWSINQREQEGKYMMRPHNLDMWGKSYRSAAEFLYSQNARERGIWKP